MTLTIDLEKLARIALTCEKELVEIITPVVKAAGSREQSYLAAKPILELDILLSRAIVARAVLRYIESGAEQTT